MQPKLILIGGGSASGKTYLAKFIKLLMGNELSIISLDNFYRNNVNLTFEERTKVNYDAPDSIDVELLQAKAKELLSGNDIDIPVYDFAKHLRSLKTQEIKCTKYIIFDGIFALSYPELLDMASLKIFVNADENVRLARRINRDVQERGRTKESVLQQFSETVAPMHNIYIEPTKKLADIVFENNENNGLSESAVRKLIDKIKSL